MTCSSTVNLIPGQRSAAMLSAGRSEAPGERLFALVGIQRSTPGYDFAHAFDLSVASKHRCSLAEFISLADRVPRLPYRFGEQSAESGPPPRGAGRALPASC